MTRQRESIMSVQRLASCDNACRSSPRFEIFELGYIALDELRSRARCGHDIHRAPNAPALSSSRGPAGLNRAMLCSSRTSRRTLWREVVRLADPHPRPTTVAGVLKYSPASDRASKRMVASEYLGHPRVPSLVPTALCRCDVCAARSALRANHARHAPTHCSQRTLGAHARSARERHRTHSGARFGFHAERHWSAVREERIAVDEIDLPRLTHSAAEAVASALSRRCARVPLRSPCR